MKNNTIMIYSGAILIAIVLGIKALMAIALGYLAWHTLKNHFGKGSK